jgi:acetyl esterase/lipase
MSFLHRFFGLLKILAILVLSVAISIPLHYGSTNLQYLRLRLFHSTLSLKHAVMPDPTRPTLSADYRAFEEIMRMIPLGEFDPTKDIFTVIKEARLSFTLGTTVPKPSQCQINKEVFEHDGHSVDTYWIDYHQNNFQKNSDKILLFFHGGGYMIGDIHGKLDLLCSDRRSVFVIKYFNRL